MGPEALARYAKGEKLPATQMRTPLVELPLGATGAPGGWGWGPRGSSDPGGFSGGVGVAATGRRRRFVCLSLPDGP